MSMELDSRAFQAWLERVKKNVAKIPSGQVYVGGVGRSSAKNLEIIADHQLRGRNPFFVSKAVAKVAINTMIDGLNSLISRAGDLTGAKTAARKAARLIAESMRDNINTRSNERGSFPPSKDPRPMYETGSLLASILWRVSK